MSLKLIRFIFFDLYQNYGLGSIKSYFLGKKKIEIGDSKPENQLNNDVLYISLRGNKLPDDRLVRKFKIRVFSHYFFTLEKMFQIFFSE